MPTSPREEEETTLDESEDSLNFEEKTIRTLFEQVPDYDNRLSFVSFLVTDRDNAHSNHSFICYRFHIK